MLSLEEVKQYVDRMASSISTRFTQQEVALQDERDARLVMNDQATYVRFVQPIVEQLRAHSNQNYKICLERHYHRGMAKSDGTISLDYATLNKPTVELALTLAHEWGHHVLKHLQLGVPQSLAERQADYYGGYFLGKFHYDIDEIIRIKLQMPDMQTVHGSRYERAMIVAQGYFDGKASIAETDTYTFWPSYEAHRAQFSLPEWPLPPTWPLSANENQESSSRKFAR